MTATTRLHQMRFSAILQWRSLKTRVTIFTLAIFVISIWTLMFYASRMLREDMQRLLGDQQFSTVSLIAAGVNQELDDRLRALEKVAEQISPAILGNTAALQALLEHSPIFQILFNGGAFVTRPDGTAIADVPLSTGRLGLNWMDRDHIAAALKEGKATIGRPLMGRALRAPIVGMAVPIRDPQGKVMGALIGATDLGKPNFLDRIVGNHYGKTGGYLLVAPQHRLIVTATDKSRIMEASPAPGRFPLIDRFMQGYEGTGILVNPLGVEVLESAKGIPVAGWYVAAQLPNEEAFAPINDMQRRMLLAAIFLTLLAGGLTWWMLRRQLSPMLAAVKTLAALSDTKQPPQPLPITSQDEIGELIGGFNHLLKTLGQREEALRESEGKYRNILESIEDGYFEVDLAGNFTFFNNSVCRILGYNRAELMGMNNRQYTDKETGQKLFKIFNNTFRTGEPSKGVDCEIIRKDATKLYIESSASLIRNTSGQPIGFRGIMRNINERKRAEEAIVVAKNDWENTFDNVTDMITIHDEDFNIVRANPAAKAIFGLQLQEGMPLAKCFRCYHGTEKPPIGCASCQSLQTGKPSTVEMFEPYLNKHLEIRAMPRFGSDGRSVGLIHVVRDITERKKMEEGLQHTLDRLRKAVGTTIQVMASAVEARDPYTAGHQIRSADLARVIATEMGLPQDKIEGIRIAGSIHDIGKLSIPAEILSKPTKLSDIEFALIKEHARKGYEMLKDVESPWPLAEIVRQHHERMDGSGYPRNLKGEAILIEARILTVADVVEAMASHRPYRPGLGIDAALNEIEKNRGIFYDSTVADICLRLFREKRYELPRG